MEKIIEKSRLFFTPQKTEERVRFTLALTKLIGLLMLALGAKLVTSNSRLLNIRWRGINPSAYCITDSSHLLFSGPFLTLMQTPFIRTTLQILSSLMIDAAFFYFVATWYVLSLTEGSWSQARHPPDVYTLSYSFTGPEPSFSQIFYSKYQQEVFGILQEFPQLWCLTA